MQSLALAMVGYWASEALFWGFPPVPGDPLTLGFTLLVYALVIAAVLSAAQVTGARGGAGLVLGGALFGFLIEGVIVDTMMWSVPITLVWVPLAWHMPLSVLAAIAAVRRGGRWLALAIPALIGAGIVNAGYFPTVRSDLPGLGTVLAYQLPCLALAVAGHRWLDRLGPLARAPRGLVWALALGALGLWLWKVIGDPQPKRLLAPLMIGLTLWGMRASGRAGPAEMPGLGHAGGRMGWLALPVAATVLAGQMVRDTPGFPGNEWLALSYGPVGLALWLWALGRSFRTARRSRRPVPQATRSKAGERVRP